MSANDRGTFGSGDDELTAAFRRALVGVSKASALVADRIIDLYRDGRGLASAPERELRDLGMTVVQARRLVAAFQLARAHDAVRSLRPGTIIRCPEAAAAAIRAAIRRATTAEQEVFVTLALTSRQRLIEARVVAIGSLAQVDVHAREVMRPAIRCGAHALVLGHTHPSGDPTPSEADVDLTRRLLDVGRLVGIPVLDHLVVTDTAFMSLAALGIIAGSQLSDDRRHRHSRPARRDR